MSKRALLLAALRIDETTQHHFLNSDDRELASDLIKRVLPITAPPYFRSGGDALHSFVVNTLCLVEMWKGEKIYVTK